MMNEADLIAQIEQKYDELENAEKALKWCSEIVDSYFKLSGSRTDEHNSRYMTIQKIVSGYFANKKEGESNENRRVQSKHN
jgi:hypothetical protein